MFGGSTFDSTTFDTADVTEFTFINVPDKPNFLQVRTEAGVLLHRLDAWFDADVTLKVNTPGVIAFSIPPSHPAVQDNSLCSPNEIWWYDSGHQLRHKFMILEEEIIYDQDGSATYKVIGEDYLTKLAAEVNAVNGALIPLTVTEAVNRIITAQVNDRPVTLGYIDPIIADTEIEFGDSNSGSTFLSLLNGIRAQDIGGLFYVDADLRLNWLVYSNAAQIVFNMKHNLGGYSEKRKSSMIYNRIYIKGQLKADLTRVGCSAPGYKENVASIALYGLRSKTFTNSKIRTTAGADAIAQAAANTYSNPPIARTFPVIDVQTLKRGTQLTDDDVNETLYLGLPIKVVIPSLAPSAPISDDVITVNVTGLKRNLGEFAQIEVTFGEDGDDGVLGSPIDTIIDQLADQSNNNDNQNNQDTQDIADIIDGLGGGGGGGATQHIELTDCPNTYGEPGQPVKNNADGDGFDYVEGGDEGEFLQKTTNSAAWANPILVVESFLDLPIPDNGAPRLAQVTSNDFGLGGFYLYPKDGGESPLGDWRDWLFVTVLKQGAVKSDLGNPQRRMFGFCADPGNDRGLWFYTNNTQTTADWEPVNQYSAAG